MPMITLLMALLALVSPASPPFKTQLHYTLRVDSADLSGVAVELRVSQAPASMQLAAHAHPEYDDKYWRYTEGLTATDAMGRALPVVREDSVRWRVSNPAGDVVVRYRVNFPRESTPRASWRPFLAPGGGLLGGPHSFLYVVGQERAPVDVMLDIPRSWRVGTGLAGGSSARAFHAPDVLTLMESPMLVGALSEWTFRVRDVPHHVFYWPLPNAAPFDTVAFVRGVERLAVQAMDLFGGAPYREYAFLFQDGASRGGLEHPNSVTLGALSSDLARDPYVASPETAHEFVHTWNLMAIQPASYRGVDYRVQPPVAELWFSEGLTMFYADLLQRRAGLRTADSTRIQHLENLIARYLSAPGNARYSAEDVSRVAYNAPPGALGDYTASTHLQGELLGNLLDMLVRDATDGARSMDDVMRVMYERFSARRFTSGDVQAAVESVCRCSAAAVFEGYVRRAGAIDFDRYLSPLGLRVSASWGPAVDRDGKPVVDLRMWGWDDAGQVRLRVADPASGWGRAGLHTNDQLVSVNGAPVRSWSELRAILLAFTIGDTAAFVVQRPEGRFDARVVMQVLERPVVRLLPIPEGTPRQRRLLGAWLGGRGANRPPP